MTTAVGHFCSRCGKAVERLNDPNDPVAPVLCAVCRPEGIPLIPGRKTICALCGFVMQEGSLTHLVEEDIPDLRICPACLLPKGVGHKVAS